MKKAICPATKEVMDCKNCKYVPNGGWCPIWDIDKLNDDWVKYHRRVAEFTMEVVKKQSEKSHGKMG
jgi:hypothetical protein